MEVPLRDAVHANREDIHEIQVLAVLGEHGRERVLDNVSNPPMRRFAKSFCPVRAHSPIFVLNDLSRFHSAQSSHFQPIVHQERAPRFG